MKHLLNAPYAQALSEANPIFTKTQFQQFRHFIGKETRVQVLSYSSRESQSYITGLDKSQDSPKAIQRLPHSIPQVKYYYTRTSRDESISTGGRKEGEKTGRVESVGKGRTQYQVESSEKVPQHQKVE